MKKRYSRRYICEAIAYWKKQLRQLNESNDTESSSSAETCTYDDDPEVDRILCGLNDKMVPKVKIHLSNIKWINGGTPADIAPRNADIEVDPNENILKQIYDYFDKTDGILPIAFDMQTAEPVKNIVYDKLMELDPSWIAG